MKGIDVGGLGGTSFAAVEYYRTENEGTSVQRFLGRLSGIGASRQLQASLKFTQTVKIPVIASGGVRDGTDIAKALALSASLASVSHPVLKTAVKGAAETESLLSLLIEELRNVMFLVGRTKRGAVGERRLL